MKKFVISTSLGFIVNNVVATLIAIFVLNPFLNPLFEGTVRTKEEGIVMPALLGGYLLLSIMMAWLFPKLKLEGTWMSKGLIFGLACGAMTFVAGHLIVAGWSVLPVLPMLFSGILDSISTLCTGLVIAYVYRDE
ncbi:MAG: hypothetical protein OCD76_13835 [Reichenbachiella sp.]